MRRLQTLVLAAATATFAVSTQAAVTPSPALDPAETVRVQLDALAHNDSPQADAGIQTVFGFASPGNRSITGPLARFALMLHKGFPELINHRSATLQPTYVKGDAAMQGVEVIDRQGSAHRYIFVLSRQTVAPCKGCWMTDSVLTGGARNAQTL